MAGREGEGAEGELPISATRRMDQPPNPAAAQSLPKKTKLKPLSSPESSDFEDLVQSVFALPPFYLTMLFTSVLSLAVALAGANSTSSSPPGASPLLYMAVGCGVISLSIGSVACSTRNLRRRNALFEVALPFGCTPIVIVFFVMVIRWLNK